MCIKHEVNNHLRRNRHCPKEGKEEEERMFYALKTPTIRDIFRRPLGVTKILHPVLFWIREQIRRHVWAESERKTAKNRGEDKK